MADLLNSLKSLKEKLSNIESEIVETKVEAKKVENIDNTELLEERCLEILNMRNTKVVINCGGTRYPLTQATINNTKHPNIFQNDTDTEIFYDGSENLFSIIVDIFRNITKTSDFSESQKFKITLNRKDDEFVLRAMIEEIFTTSSHELMKELNIERKKIVAPVVTNPEATVTAPIVNNYDYGGGAAYNRNYGY